MIKEQIREYMKQNLGIDDAETFDFLYENFLSTCDETIVKIEQALKNADSAALRLAAHSLKGCAANVGAEALRAVCFELEHEAVAKDFSRGPEHLAEIRKQRALL